MTRLISVFVLLLAVSTQTQARPPQQSSARSLVDASIEAMGGSRRLVSISTLSFSSMEHQFALEQSERPEGPWLTTYVQAEETRDLHNNRARRNTGTRSLLAGTDWNELSLIRNGDVTAFEMAGQVRPYPSSLAMPWIDGLRLGPERLLLVARDADDLSLEGHEIVQGVDHMVLAFTLEGMPVRLFLNMHTKLPTAVEIRHPAYFDIWGDVAHRTYFSFWFLEENGIRYPRQWDTTLDGAPFRSTTILDLEFNMEVPADTFAIPDEVRALSSRMEAMSDMHAISLGIPNRPASEIAPGIIEIPGRWDVTIVRQEDGLVILEAPISSEYSVLVLAEAEKRFPGVPVKAVVTTSDAWPHLGGVREYAARGIPVIAMDLNRPILERLLAAEYTSRPDAWQGSDHSAAFVWLDAPMTLGSGPNRMVIHPIRGEGSERMLMVDFPEHNLLYASDMVQKLQDGSFFMPQYLSEIVDAVRREQLDVETVFAMHLSPTPMTEILEAVRSQRLDY